VARWKAVTGPISTNVVSRAVAPAWRRVTGQAACRLGESQPGALGRAQEGVEEAARERDVVVDHEQPVVGRQRVGGDERVEVLELAARALGHGDHVDRVAAARELRPRGAHQRARPLDAERQHAPA
jgi:hypothetical protein